MKKADNFNIKQWLDENKVTSQSRLNEEKEIMMDKKFEELEKQANDFASKYGKVKI
jgi:hypothetical protein